MNLSSFFVGFCFGLPLVILCMKLFKGKFLGIDNRYFAGTLYGFWIWGVLMLLLFIDGKYDLLGLVNGDDGLAVVTVISSSVRGFIASGLLAGVISAKILRI